MLKMICPLEIGNILNYTQVLGVDLSPIQPALY